MDNLNDISNRISAVEETRKITNAMKLVSSSRVKKILKSLEYNTLYYEKVTATMKDILAAVGNDSIDHPYFIGHDKKIKSDAFLIFAGDKGLAGAYNHNLLDFAFENVKKEENPSIITIGNIAQEYFNKHRIPSSGYRLRFPLEQTLNNARRIETAIKDLFDREYVDEVYLIYTSFFGKSKNKPVKQLLLPIKRGQNLVIAEDAKSNEIMYIPSAKQTFDLLIPQYIMAIIFDVLVQVYAGEQYARMNAMDASTQNADEILKKLKLQYNLARQASITNEIAEVAAASLMQEEDEFLGQIEKEDDYE